MRLHLTPDNGNDEMELMNAVFDEKTRELTTLSKGRGLGGLWRSEPLAF